MPIGRRRVANLGRQKRCCRSRGLFFVEAKRSDCRSRQVASYPDLERNDHRMQSQSRGVSPSSPSSGQSPAASPSWRARVRRRISRHGRHSPISTAPGRRQFLLHDKWPQQRPCIIGPTFLVKLGRKEPACLILQQRIYPGDKVARARIAAAKVLFDNVLGRRDESLMRAFSAFHLRLAANSLCPYSLEQAGE